MALFDTGTFVANVELTDTFDVWRIRTNQINTQAAGLASNNTFTGTLNSFNGTASAATLTANTAVFVSLQADGLTLNGDLTADDVTANTFAGDGSLITALNASQITTGTIPDARIQATGVTQHQASITGTGALNSGSITSGFGAINIGTSALTAGSGTYSNPVTAPSFAANTVAGATIAASTGTTTDTKITFPIANTIAFTTSTNEQARIDRLGYFSGVWADQVTNLGNSGTATNITCTGGNVFTCTLTDNCTFTLDTPSNATAGTATSFTLVLTNDATPGRTVAFAGGTFKYPGGSVSRTTTANAIDIWFFFSPDGGTNWYVSIPMLDLT